MYMWPGAHPGCTCTYGRCSIQTGVWEEEVIEEDCERRERLFLGDDLEEELHIYTLYGPRVYVRTHTHIHTPRVCPQEFKCIYTHIHPGWATHIYICIYIYMQFGVGPWPPTYIYI